MHDALGQYAKLLRTSEQQPIDNLQAAASRILAGAATRDATCSRLWRGSGKQRDFAVLTEGVDTTTTAGRMMIQMLGAFAEFERAMLKERTKAGTDGAREAGRIAGRRPKLSDQQQSEIRKIITKGDKTAR